MAIDGPRGPMDDPRERRPDRRPDPYPRGPVSDPDDRMVEADGRSDAERLADALDDGDELELPGPAEDRRDREPAGQDRSRVDADRRLQADRDRQRLEQDRQRQADQDRERQADEDRRQAEQDRQRDEQRQQEQDRQRQEDRDRQERDDQRDDPARDVAEFAGPAVAAAAAAEMDEPERGPNRLADRPSDVEAALDPDANRRWQEPGVVPTREELDQALDPEGRFTAERQEQARQERRERIEQALNGENDRDEHTAAGPAPAIAEADGQPDRDRSGREEDYAGRHRVDDGPQTDQEQGGRHRAAEDGGLDGRPFDSGAPDQRHWAPPAADTQVRRDAGDRQPGHQPDQQRDARREGPDRQGRAAPAQGPGRQQEQQQRDSQDGKKLAAGGLAATGKAIGGADALIEGASPTGRAAVSQRWEYSRGTRPGDRALNKAMSLLNNGQRSASEATRQPPHAPEAVPHSGAHTPGQFHQRHQSPQQQQQQQQNRQRGS